jgi:hypothetical protein
MSDEFFIAALMMIIAVSNIPLAVMAYWYDQSNTNAIFHTLCAAVFTMIAMFALASA